MLPAPLYEEEISAGCEEHCIPPRAVSCRGSISATELSDTDGLAQSCSLVGVRTGYPVSIPNSPSCSVAQLAGPHESGDSGEKKFCFPFPSQSHH